MAKADRKQQSSTNHDNDKARLYQALSPATYEQGDKKFTRWTQVGIGFESKDKLGINLEIAPGISVTGRIVIRPFDAKSDEQGQGVPTGPGRFVHDTSTPVDQLV